MFYRGLEIYTQSPSRLHKNATVLLQVLKTEENSTFSVSLRNYRYKKNDNQAFRDTLQRAKDFIDNYIDNGRIK